MPAEHSPEETTQSHQPLEAESDMFVRIGQLARELDVTDAGAYFIKASPRPGGVTQILAMNHEADGTLFFACNHTAQLAYAAGSLKRTMDAFLVDPERKELAYLTPTTMFYGSRESRWRGQFRQGPLIADKQGMVGISYWDAPQLVLQPSVSSPQSSRLEYENSPVAFRAGVLVSRLVSLEQESKQERVVLPIGV